MNKPIYFFAVLWLALILLVVFTDLDVDAGIEKAIDQGNQLHASGQDVDALAAYEEGLTMDEANERLKHNAAMAAYEGEDYGTVLEYLEHTDQDYIFLGNAHYYLAVVQPEPDQQIQGLEKALETYHQGMTAFPQDVQLKYNYEWVLKMLDEKVEEQKEAQEQEQEDGEGKEGDETQDQENGDGEKDGEEKEGGEGQDGDVSNDPKEDMGQGQNGEEKDGNESGDVGEEAVDTASEGVQQILQILEQQEQESLKNNQEVQEAGGADSHDW